MPHSRGETEKGPEPPFEAYSGDEPYVFVAYARADASVVYPEIARLDKMGYRIWYDEGIVPGRDWPDDVAAALERCACFLVFISPRSVQRPNVRREINFAVDSGKPLLAVHIEETSLSAGLRLQIGTPQAILMHTMQLDRYERKLDQALPRACRGRGPSESGTGRSPVPRRDPAGMEPDHMEYLLLRRPAAFIAGSAPRVEAPGYLVGTRTFTASIWCKVTDEVDTEREQHRYLFAYHDPRGEGDPPEGRGQVHTNVLALKAWAPERERARFVLVTHGPDPADQGIGWCLCERPQPPGWCYLAVTRQESAVTLVVGDVAIPAPPNITEEWPINSAFPPALRLGAWAPEPFPDSYANTELFRFHLVPSCMSWRELAEDRQAGLSELRAQGEDA